MDELGEIRARKLAELQAYAQERAVQKTTKPVHLTDATFDSEVGRAGVTLVDFWAAWCGPCLRIAPMIEQLAADWAGKVRVAKLNVDENPATAGKFGVQSIPTLLVFRNGELVDAVIGAVPRAQVERVLQKWT